MLICGLVFSILPTFKSSSLIAVRVCKQYSRGVREPIVTTTPRGITISPNKMIVAIKQSLPTIIRFSLDSALMCSQEVYLAFSPSVERIWLESKKRLPKYVAQKAANLRLRSQHALRLYGWDPFGGMSKDGGPLDAGRSP